MRERASTAPWLAGLGVLCVAGAAFPYTVDDAYVVGRYAARIARGLGWTFQDGAPTDGVTGPLALVPGVIAELAGLDPVLALKTISACCGALAAALACRAASRHALGGPSSVLVGVLSVTGATLGVWSAAGLETGIAALGATLAALSFLARPTPHGTVLGLSIAALAWLRPELAVFAVVLLGAALARDRRQGAVAIAIGALGAIAVLLFRWKMFGTPIPLAWYAKPGELARGLAYVGRALIASTGLAGIALVLAPVRRSRNLRALAFAIAMQVLAFALAGGDWMPGFRLFAPLIPSYALLAGIGGARAIALARGRRRVVGIVLVALAIAIPAIDLAIQIPAMRSAGATRERVGRPLAHALAHLAEGGAVALVDVGFLPYAGELPRVVDLAGITDPVVGRLPGRHLAKTVEPGLLEARGVSVLLLRSFSPPRIDAERRLEALDAEPVELRLAVSAWVRERFRVERVVEWSPEYFYVVLVRARE